jgi:hypothetical protein
MRNILVLLVTAIFLSGCPALVNDCPYQEFKFTIPWSLTPRLDTFRIGDTFWVKSIIPPRLLDSNSRKEYSFLPEFEHIQYAIFDNLTDSIEYVKAKGADYFDYFTTVGTAQRGRIGPAKGFQFKYKKTPGQPDSLVVGFVPRVPGVYLFTTSIFTEEYRKEDGIVRKGCFDAVLLSYSMNDRIDSNNYHLIVPATFFKYPYSGYTRDGSYTFWVAE